jgi:hypothetical protein
LLYFEAKKSEKNRLFLKIVKNHPFFDGKCSKIEVSKQCYAPAIHAPIVFFPVIWAHFLRLKLQKTGLSGAPRRG